MRPIAEQLGQLTRLEELAGQNSPIHRLHPGAKLAATGVYLLCVLSLGRLQFGRLAPYLLYPVVVLNLAEVPLGLVFRRAALALPFCAFAGLSNLLLERQVLLRLGPVPVTVGWPAVGCCFCGRCCAFRRCWRWWLLPHWGSSRASCGVWACRSSA